MWSEYLCKSQQNVNHVGEPSAGHCESPGSPAALGVLILKDVRGRTAGEIAVISLCDGGGVVIPLLCDIVHCQNLNKGLARQPLSRSVAKAGVEWKVLWAALH